jgi:hypothetical protein
MMWKSTSKELQPMNNTERKTNRLYRGGTTAPAGTYVCLDDGRFARLESRGMLPRDPVTSTLYLRVSSSPELQAPLSLVSESFMAEAV